jgi:membrane protein DedA with SNARE-associated domain
MLHSIVTFLVDTIFQLGYAGIFALMFLESSFFPFPSEVVMVPAGYLAQQGEMNIYLVVLMGVLGSLAGAWLNYMLALKFGRGIVLKILSEEKLNYLEEFFKNHGSISTFNGRLIPGIRQYISFPAGLSKMDPAKFTLYTALGAGIWSIVLVLIGYFIGSNQELINEYLRTITIFTLIGVVLLSIGYIWFTKRQRRSSDVGSES